MTSRLHPTDAPAPQGDFINIAPAVAERLLGEPSNRSAREWRWGRKGSFRLKLDTGTWSDFEAGDGGGVLALVMREERLDKSGALGQRQLFWPLCANYFGRSGSGVIVVCNCRSCACRPCASLVR